MDQALTTLASRPGSSSIRDRTTGSPGRASCAIATSVIWRGTTGI